MRLRQLGINPKRLFGGLEGVLESALWQVDRVETEKRVDIGDAGMSKRIAGILADRLLETVECRAQASPVSAVPVEAALLIEVIRARVVRVAPAERPAPQSRQLHAQPLDDALRDLFLQADHVGHLPVVRVREKMRSIGRADELRRDSKTI